MAAISSHEEHAFIERWRVPREKPHKCLHATSSGQTQSHKPWWCGAAMLLSESSQVLRNMNGFQKAFLQLECKWVMKISGMLITGSSCPALVLLLICGGHGNSYEERRGNEERGKQSESRMYKPLSRICLRHAFAEEERWWWNEWGLRVQLCRAGVPSPVSRVPCPVSCPGGPQASPSQAVPTPTGMPRFPATTQTKRVETDMLPEPSLIFNDPCMREDHRLFLSAKYQSPARLLFYSA